MNLFKEIYGIMQDVEDGERLGISPKDMRKLVDEDVVPRRYSKGPGVGYPSAEEEEDALALDADEDALAALDGEEDALALDGEEDALASDAETLPEQILDYARDLMDQGKSAEEAARSAADMIYDELISALQDECEDCPDEEFNSDEEMNSADISSEVM